MKVGSLFAGIGGFDLGLERAGMTIAWQSEIDPYASAVLRKHWPHVPNHGDVRNIRAGTVEPVDLICGGFPCQPFSHTGKRAGADDDRHLWPEYRRVVEELRPTWVVGENVPGIISMELDSVLADLEGLGYATRTLVVPAVAVDAPHRRDRVWIIARDTRRPNANGNDRHVEPDDQVRAGRLAATAVRDRDRDRESACAVNDETQGMPGHVADADKSRPQGWIGTIMRECAEQWSARSRNTRRATPYEWLPEPDVGRVAHGVPSRVDRLRCLGNAVVPAVVEVIGRAIMTPHTITGER